MTPMFFLHYIRTLSGKLNTWMTPGDMLSLSQRRKEWLFIPGSKGRDISKKRKSGHFPAKKTVRGCFKIQRLM